MRHNHTGILAREFGWFSLVLLVFIGAARAGQPAFEWVAQPDPLSGAVSQGASVQTDAGDNSYVGGFAKPTASFGTNQLRRDPKGVFFLAKYNPNGEPLWAVGLPAGRELNITQHVVTDAGEIYLSVIGPTIKTMTILKYNTEGKLLWERSRTNLTFVLSMTLEPSGNLIFVGSNESRSDVIVRCDPELNVLRSWHTVEVGVHNVMLNSVAPDSAGNLFVAGQSPLPTVTFGSITVTNPSPTDTLVFVFKFDAAGEPMWGRALDVLSLAGTVLCKPTPSGSGCFVCSKRRTSQNLELVRLTKFDGNGLQEWARDISDGRTQVASLDVDAREMCLVSGITSADSIAGTKLEHPVGPFQDPDIFLAAFDGGGGLVWLVSVGSPTYDYVHTASWGRVTGEVRLLGRTEKSAIFGNLGTLPALDSRMFLAKLTEFPLSPAVRRQPADQSITSGDTALLSVGATGTPPLSYAWLKEGVPLGATSNNTLVVPHFSARDTGSYSVVVSSPFGSVTSSPAILKLAYGLKVVIEGNGTVTRSPDLTNYPPGTSVELTATPGALDDFLGWSGDVSGPSSSATVLLETNRTVTAHFVNTALQLRVVGQGSVAQFPLRSHYRLGDSVELSAIPARWFRFDRWEDGTTIHPRTVRVGTNNNFTAIFEPVVPLETLTFNGVSRTAPLGMPAVFVNGKFVTNLSVHTVGPTSVRLGTSLDQALIFYSLNGSSPTLLDRAYDGQPFTLTRSATLRAVAFDKIFTPSEEGDPVRIEIEPAYELHLATSRGGIVDISPTAPESGFYPSNSVVTLTARPTDGSSFLQWLGDATGTNSTVSLRMNRDRCVEAVFGTTLQLGTSTLGNLHASPDSPIYAYDSVVKITAIPESGNTFVLWSGDAKGTNTPLRFTITQPRPTIAAGFAALPAGQVSLTVEDDGAGSVLVSPPGNRFRTSASVTLTAMPEEDQQFLGWAGDAAGSENPLRLSMAQSRNVVARFTKRPRLELHPCAEPLQDGTAEFQLIGEPNATYEIETSQDPGGPWKHVLTVLNPLGRIQVTVPSSPGALRFFRATFLP